MFNDLVASAPSGIVNAGSRRVRPNDADPVEGPAPPAAVLPLTLREAADTVAGTAELVTMKTALPRHEGLEVERLAGVFRNTTQAYKHLFLRAILACLAKGGGDGIQYADLLPEMAEAAWWPARRYRLSIGNLGVTDQITRLLDAIGDDPDEVFTVRRVREVAHAQLGRQVSRGVLRYVPQRFLQPWLQGAYGDVGDGQFDRFVKDYSLRLMDARALPYGIAPAGDGIRLNPVWRDYILSNLPIVTGWSDFEWLSWVQARNPNVPVTMEKLGPPSDRVSLEPQHAFFRAALSVAPPICIYTGGAIAPASLSLDHFLPRSFVGHDRIWNLVPMARAANSGKGARLPRPVFVEALADLHHRTIVALDPMGSKRWRRFGEEYAGDLRIEPEALLDRERLVEAYRGTVGPMLAIATRMGFPAGWP